MGFDLTALDNYTKEGKDSLLAAAIMGSKTASLMTPQPGIKTSENINILETDAVFQAGGSCDNTPSGTTAILDRKITVGKIMVMEHLCPPDLEAKYTQLLLAPGSKYEGLPGEIEAKYVDQKIAKIKAALEVALWQGDTASATVNLKRFDGLLKDIDAEGTVIDGNPDEILDTTGIIASNVRTIFQQQYELVPVQLLDKEDLFAACGWDVFRTLLAKITADKEFNYTTDEAAKTGELTYPGTTLRIVALNGLNGTNRIITTRKSNLILGTDLMNEEEKVEMKWLPEAEKVRFKVDFKMGARVAFPSEVISFKLATA